jgi:major vault protein
MTGEIKLVKGPHMLLADPVTEVIVRRILSEKQVSLWFPGNAEAMLYNRALAQVAEDADVAAQNFVSDNAVRSRVLRETPAVSAKSSPPPGAPQQANAPAAAAASVPEAATATFGSQVRRGSQYTPPRMVTLDTKYDGAVSIGPYVGYAVQVVSKTGERQVVVGPANHLLEYDETLDVISLSTGTPKNHDNVIQTVYLQTQNNRVTDDYEVETRDMVRVNLRIACRLHFEGDPTNWFKVDNYIRLLCQHIKSRLSSAAKQHEIGDFYNNAIAIVRDTILGKQNEADNKRPGLAFAENGMRVYDVEVLAVSINDGQINLLLQQSQVDAFKATLQLGNLQRMLNTTRQSEGMKQQIAAEEAATVRKKIELQVEQMMADFKATIQRRQNEIDEAARLVEIEQVKQKAADVAHQATLAREKLAVDQSLTVEKQRQDLTLAMISAESQALSQRIAGIQGPLGDVLLALSSNETMQKLAQASAPLSILGGSTIVDVIGKALEQTGLAAAYQLAKGGAVDGKSKGVGSLVRESTRRKQD